MCRVSVIMAVYNEKEEWIKQSIDSILNQTFSDFEFIIINDNPQRKENELLLSEYAKKDKRIIIITNEQNIGLTKSLNKGIKIAKGEYIARMDADDISLPERFTKQVKFLDANNKCIVCGTNISYIGNKKKITYSDWIKYKNDEIKAQLMFNSCFAHPTVMIRKGILYKNNITYDENYRQAQDYRLWEVLSGYGEFANVKEKLLQYRISDKQVSKRQANGQLNLAQSIRERLIWNWLKSININCEKQEDIYEYLKLSKINFIKEQAKRNCHSIEYLNNYLKILYFSSKESKIKLLMSFYLMGDFLRFNIKTNLRFIAFIVGVKAKSLL